MWGLFIIFLAAPPGMGGWHYLHHYDTKAECEEWKESVTEELKIEYPDTEFELKCFPKREDIV